MVRDKLSTRALGLGLGFELVFRFGLRLPCKVYTPTMVSQDSYISGRCVTTRFSVRVREDFRVEFIWV
jgi:hypothetical protein